jgi:hypothetical protein
VDIYWNTVISCYEVLKADKVAKGEEKIKLYLNFEDLYDMAVKHKKTNNIPSEKGIFGPSASRITSHKKEQHSPTSEE